jgi:hypothetical protein
MPDTMTVEAPTLDLTPPPASQVPAVAAALPAPAAEPITMLDIIDRASRDPGVDVDKLDRLLAMQERVLGRESQVAYDNAMADAQEAMKPIRANLENPQTKSEYADYAALDRAIRPIYAKHGFSLSFNTGDGAPAGEVRVVCTVAHRGGHREHPHLDMPADGKGARGGDVMTKTHATGAAITYGKRYLLGMIFNLAVTRDDDGNGASGNGDDDVERLGTGPRGADGRRMSTYSAKKATDAQEWANQAIEYLNLTPNVAVAKDWRREKQTVAPGKKKSPLQMLKDASPGQFLRVAQCYQNVTGEDLE